MIVTLIEFAMLHVQLSTRALRKGMAATIQPAPVVGSQQQAAHIYAIYKSPNRPASATSTSAQKHQSQNFYQLVEPGTLLTNVWCHVAQQCQPHVLTVTTPHDGKTTRSGEAGLEVVTVSFL
jgi:hypothetical protein